MNGQPGVCKPCTNSVPANASYSGRGGHDEPTSCPITCSKDFPWLVYDDELSECSDPSLPYEFDGCPIAHCFFQGPGGFTAFLLAAWISYFLGLGLLNCDAQHWFKLARLVHKAALKRAHKENEKKAAAVNGEPKDGGQAKDERIAELERRVAELEAQASTA